MASTLRVHHGLLPAVLLCTSWWAGFVKSHCTSIVEGQAVLQPVETERAVARLSTAADRHQKVTACMNAQLHCIGFEINVNAHDQHGSLHSKIQPGETRDCMGPLVSLRVVALKLVVVLNLSTM